MKILLTLLWTTSIVFANPGDIAKPEIDLSKTTQKVLPIVFDSVDINPNSDGLELRNPLIETFKTSPNSDFSIQEDARDVALMSLGYSIYDMNKQGETNKFSGSWDSPGTAAMVNLNMVYSGLLLDSTTDQDWFWVSSANAGKLTFILETVAGGPAVNYDLHVFRLQGSSLVEQVTSALPGQTNEQVSVETIAGGVYFFAVTTSSGSGSNYVFLVSHGTQYDNNEPDDALAQANGLTQSGSFSGTVDSDWDVDVYQYNFSGTNTTLGINFTSDANLFAGYQILDANGNPATSFQTGDAQWGMPAGNWYIRVTQSHSSANSYAQRGYTLNTYFPTTAQVTSYSLSNWNPIPSLPNFYAVDHQCMELTAYVTDTFGTAIPFFDVHYEVMRENDQPGTSHDWQFREGNATTNASGVAHKYIRLYPTFAGSGYQVDAFWLCSGTSWNTSGLLVATAFAHYWAASGPCN